MKAVHDEELSGMASSIVAERAAADELTRQQAAEMAARERSLESRLAALSVDLAGASTHIAALDALLEESKGQVTDLRKDLEESRAATTALVASMQVCANGQCNYYKCNLQPYSLLLSNQGESGRFDITSLVKLTS